MHIYRHLFTVGLILALVAGPGALAGYTDDAAPADNETEPAPEPEAPPAPPAATIKVALVDMQRVTSQYAWWVERRAELQEWSEMQQRYLQELETRYVYLSEQHFTEMLDILRMPRPLSADAAKRRDELRELNDEKEERFLELQAKIDRTPREQDEFNQLQETVEGRLRQIDSISESLQNQLAQMQQEAQEQVVQAIDGAIQETATAGGYTLVLNRLFVLYGGDDITQVILEKLNGTPAAPAPDAGGG